LFLCFILGSIASFITYVPILTINIAIITEIQIPEINKVLKI